MDELPKAYDHAAAEGGVAARWESAKVFNPDTRRLGTPFAMVLPPANVTGVLHLGHALTVAIQDIIIRFRRMQGYRTLYLPGTDHAAIATQAKVEADLYKKAKKTRRDFSRQEFLRLVEDYAATSQATILEQLKRLGASVDWSRLAYTLDAKRTLAVRTAFQQLYEQGLIYRGQRLVNWDPKLQTNVSDDEIEWQEETVPFYYLKYGPFTIGTARPETKFGDKYVVVHQADPRYRAYQHGQKLEVPWMNGTVVATVIKDEAIDMAFGSGAMTITPAHDAADYDIAQRHALDIEPVIDLRGCLLPVAGEFAGQHISKARPAIVAKLKAQGLLERVEEKYVHRVATNSRGGGIIEPQIREQWFVAVDKPFRLAHSELTGLPQGSEVTLKQLMRHVVASGQITIIPEYFTKTYFHWIDNLRDWCISRQIVFGHQVPVWYCGDAAMKRMGFAAEVVPQVFAGKVSTWRLRDHGFKVGDTVAFEDSSTNKIFGYGAITDIELTTVGAINLQDKKHWKTYESREELMAAFKKHNPYKRVELDTPVWSYTYTFDKELRKGACGAMVVAANIPKACPTCGADSLEQDTDTLDTWFSSGLWTFSTLGWPKQTDDLKRYHPTAVLETGYDILFFWVARMILMSGAILGQAPFKTVYLHGLVRDVERQKMSKSKGNIIDPLEVMTKYGTDALRFALVYANAGGTDMAFTDDRVRGMKFFANKLWNIARFIITNAPGAASGAPAPVTEADTHILRQLAAATKEVTRHLEQFRFHEAAQTIYQFVWHELADKYVEASKAQLHDERTAASTQQVLRRCLEQSLKLLHPFMPFVTEYIWGLLGTGTLLAVETWPEQ